jgi:nucleoside phosphorylase
VLDALFVVRGAEERAARRAVASAGAGVRVFPTDIGPQAASDAAARALVALPGPRRALVTGLCGALDTNLCVGDVLLYAEFSDVVGAPLLTDPRLTAALAAALPGAKVGVVALASSRIVTAAREKRALAERSGAGAVDMESAALVRTLQARGWAVAVLRVVSDAAADELPDLNRALGPRGEVRAGVMALEFLRNPRAGIRMARHGVRALRTLQTELTRFLRDTRQ